MTAYHCSAAPARPVAPGLRGSRLHRLPVLVPASVLDLLTHLSGPTSVVVSLADGWHPERGEPLDAVWTEQCRRSGPPPPTAAGVYGATGTPPHRVARTSRLWGLDRSLIGAGSGWNGLLVPRRCTPGAFARYYAACGVDCLRELSRQMQPHASVPAVGGFWRRSGAASVEICRSCQWISQFITPPSVRSIWQNP